MLDFTVLDRVRAALLLASNLFQRRYPDCTPFASVADIRQKWRAWVGVALLIQAMASPVMNAGGYDTAIAGNFLLAARSEWHAHEWRPVSPETLSITSLVTNSGNQGTIPSAYYVSWQNAALKYWQAARMTVLGSTYPIYFYGNASGNVTGLYNSCPYFVEFSVDGMAFEIIARGNTRYRLWIDGRLYSGPRTLLTSGVSGDLVTTKFAFPSRRLRVIRFESSEPFGGLRFENSASFIPSTTTYPVWMCVGDSFDEGTGSYDGQYNGFVASIGRKFGVAMVNSGSGATGYSTNGGVTGRFRYFDRIQDVALNKPEVLFVNGTVNGNTTITEAVAGEYYDAVKAVSPNTRIIVRGPSWATSPPASILAARNAIAAACAARGILFIDPVEDGALWFTPQNTVTFFGTTATTSATATIVGGVVTAVTGTMFSSGWDVLERPSVTITGNGTGARATAVMSVRLTAVEMLAQGSGYTEASVEIVGGGGSGATAAAVISDGRITGISILTAGTGFTGRPTVKIIGDGSGAVASAFVSGVVTGYTVTNGGSGYTSATVSISASGDGTHPKLNGHDYIAEKTVAALPYRVRQSVVFPQISAMDFVTGPLSLAATSSSGLPVSYSVVSGPAVVVDGQLWLTGAGTVVVRAVQSGNGTYFEAVQELSFVVNPNFAAWGFANFTEEQRADLAIAGSDSDPDQDGLVNLVEYALGTSPTEPSSFRWEVGTTTSEWVYTYTRPAARSDVTYVVEVSTTLTSWTTDGVTHELVSTDAVAGTQTWRARYPMAGAANAFFRLKVTSP